MSQLKKSTRACTALILVFTFSMHSSLAAAQFSSPQNMAVISAREYFVGRDMGKPLVTVHLLNGVTSPGVYHVPYDTDIAQLIAYAGGASDRSDLGGIVVRRGQKGVYNVTQLDLEKALKEPKDLFHIQDQDVVQIEQRVNVERPLQWISIASAIASIALSVYLIEGRK